MSTRRTLTRIVEEELVIEGILPGGDQVPQSNKVLIVIKENEAPIVPPNMSYEEVTVAFLTLYRDMSD